MFSMFGGFTFASLFYVVPPKRAGRGVRLQSCVLSFPVIISFVGKDTEMVT